jgi:hypothetical protein
VAVTLRERSMSTLQVPVPVQAPVHPAKVEGATGDATSTTVVNPRKGKDAEEHWASQTIPAGEEVTDPVPGPGLTTSST